MHARSRNDHIATLLVQGLGSWCMAESDFNLNTVQNDVVSSTSHEGHEHPSQRHVTDSQSSRSRGPWHVRQVKSLSLSVRFSEFGDADVPGEAIQPSDVHAYGILYVLAGLILGVGTYSSAAVSL